MSNNTNMYLFIICKWIKMMAHPYWSSLPISRPWNSIMIQPLSCFLNLSSKIVIAHFIFWYSGRAPLIQSKKRANTELGAGLYICRSRVCCPGTTRKVTLPYPWIVYLLKKSIPFNFTQNKSWMLFLGIHLLVEIKNYYSFN